MFSIDEFSKAREELGAEWRKALSDLRTEIKRAAHTERAYRKFEAAAWLRCPKSEKRGEWTAAERDAWVSAESSDLRYERDIALGLMRANFSYVTAVLADLSALQTEMNAFKQEAKALNYGSDS